MHPTHRTARRCAPPRPRRIVETHEFAGFVRRIVAAYGRRVADRDIEALADLAALATEVDTTIRQAITGLRACGYSWADIAAQLGVARQSAQERWGGEPR